MNLAKVVCLTDNVEVIVKKAIHDGQYAIDVNYIAEVNHSLFSITLTVTYKTERTRNSEFNKTFVKEELIRKGKELSEPFKSELE